jgi:hypothetical protein
MPLMFRVGFAQLFAADKSLAFQQDNTYQLVPLFSALSRSFNQGDYPFWIETIMAGLSVFNDPDFSPAYPFYLLRFDLFRTPVDAMAAIHWITVLHIFVLYVNAYIMLRCLRARPLAAFLGASLFTFSTNTASYATWINITASYAWLPLVVAAVALVFERRYSARPVLFGSIALSLLVLASPSQSLVHAMYIVGVLFAWRVLGWAVKRDSASIFTATRDLAAMGIGTVVLSSPSLIPSLMNLGQMIRFLGDFPPVTNNGRMPFDATLVGQMSPTQLASIVLPLNVPVIVGGWFIGLSAVLFALVAAFQIRRHWAIAPLAVLTIYALLSGMGSHLGLAQINYHLPFLNMVREPPRHMVVFMLGGAALAAIGFDYVTDAIRGGRKTLLTWPHGIAVGLAVAAAIGASQTSLAYAGRIPLWTILAAFALVVTLLAAGFWLSGGGQTIIFALAAGVAIAANLTYPHDDNWLLRSNNYFRQANLASHRTLSKLSTIDGIRQYRVLFEETELSPSSWSMNGSFYGVRSFQAFKNPIPNARQFHEVNQMLDIRHYYPLLGGRYYLCRSCDRLDQIAFRYDREIDDHKLYVADEAIPRYIVVGRVAGLYDTPTDFIEYLQEGFDLSREIYLDRSVTIPGLGALLRTLPDDMRAVVKEEHRSLNTLELSVSTNRPGILLLNEYFTDAWRASINGLAVRPFRVNLNQIGVLLAPGGSLVRFDYHPTMFVWLLRVQALAAILMLAYIAYITMIAVRSRREGP